MQYEESARRMLEKYVQEVKAYVRAAKTADPENVAQDVTEHIENELGETERPITVADLEVVLKRLGEPRKWVNEDDITWWRKFLLRVRGGSENWRLAYITFGLILFGYLLGWVFQETRTLLAPQCAITEQTNLYDFPRQIGTRKEYNTELFAFFVLMSFLTARASLSAAGDPMLLSSGQKWLTYPSLLVVYIPAGLFLLLCPVGIGLIIAERVITWTDAMPTLFGKTYTLFGLQGRGYQEWAMLILTACIGGSLLGLWLLVMGAVYHIRRVRAFLAVVFHPFLNPSRRTLGNTLLVLAGIVLLLSGVLIAVTEVNCKAV
jgi:hypothetical protein